MEWAHSLVLWLHIWLSLILPLWLLRLLVLWDFNYRARTMGRYYWCILLWHFTGFIRPICRLWRKWSCKKERRHNMQFILQLWNQWRSIYWRYLWMVSWNHRWAYLLLGPNVWRRVLGSRGITLLLRNARIIMWLSRSRSRLYDLPSDRLTYRYRCLLLYWNSWFRALSSYYV